MPALAWLADAGAGLAAAGAAAAQRGERSSFAAYMESWHDFHLMAGTAAVTLAGLLFVALSLHLEQLVEETHAHLLALSRSILMSFVVVLTASLMMLTPAFSPRITGGMLVAVGLVGGFLSVRLMSTVRHREEGGFTPRDMRRRRVFPLVGYGILVVAGLGVALGIPELMNWTLPAFCMLLGNAAGTSFELLVHVARHKQRSRGSQGV